jgi:uncharacterized protein
MSAQDRIDLGRLGLGSGEGRRFDLEVDVGPLEEGGEPYVLSPDPTPARLEVSRTSSGHALRLRLAGEVVGPCMRCLTEARVAVEVDAREVDQPSAGDEELTSPYVTDEVVGVAAWARDAVALALPTQLLCRPDCAGLCPVCGAPLNDADPEEHRHPSGGDPRWEPLRGLKLE